MLDQNWISILLGVLAVLGTLGGALGGTILANRHAMKLEELRIEQEKLKRNTIIIEEVYTLLTNITTQTSENVERVRRPLEGKQLQDDLRRLQTLINLYLPSLKEKLDLYMKSLVQFVAKVSTEQEFNHTLSNSIKLQESFKNYKDKMDEIKSEFEKLVR